MIVEESAVVEESVMVEESVIVGGMRLCRRSSRIETLQEWQKN
jgi:hypothetical protein